MCVTYISAASSFFLPACMIHARAEKAYYHYTREYYRRQRTCASLRRTHCGIVPLDICAHTKRFIKIHFNVLIFEFFVLVEIRVDCRNRDVAKFEFLTCNFRKSFSQRNILIKIVNWIKLEFHGNDKFSLFRVTMLNYYNFEY